MLSVSRQQIMTCGTKNSRISVLFAIARHNNLNPRKNGVTERRTVSSDQCKSHCYEEGLVLIYLVAHIQATSKNMVSEMN